MAGYLLAQGIPNVDEYLLPIIAGIILLSVIPVTLEVRRSRECDSEPGREDS